MQAQEKVGVMACVGPPHTPVRAQIPSPSALFSQPLLCHFSPMRGVFAMPFPQEITGPGWQPEQGAKAGRRASKAVEADVRKSSQPLPIQLGSTGRVQAAAKKTEV